MNLTAVLDHTALTALFRADPFFTGLYIEASRGTGRVLIPSLSVPAAERQVAGAGHHAADLRFAEKVPFTAAHAVDAMDWKNIDWPVVHAAAIAWQAVKAGEPLTVLSLEPELYATGDGQTRRQVTAMSVMRPTQEPEGVWGLTEPVGRQTEFTSESGKTPQCASSTFRSDALRQPRTARAEAALGYAPGKWWGAVAVCRQWCRWPRRGTAVPPLERSRAAGLRQRPRRRPVPARGHR
ncbi:PIN domain-containing protein [Streptomyces achromogenes]|uniref:PIN domain-containing protein n=1 Tax=Streptomyces achromogenes TaxID=67255 RepID=UPI0037211134